MSCNVITFLLTIHCIFIHVTVALECFSTDNDHYKCHFGSFTPYRYIANYNDSQSNYPGCTEKKLWLMVRHGTRFPSKKVISRMSRLLPKLQQQIIERYKRNESMVSSELVEKLAKWKFSYALDDDKKIIEEGERELIDLAERFQSRFSNLLPEKYNNHSYKFMHTATQRTEESAKHFTLGLFGYLASRKVWYYPPQKKDIILRPYKHCHRWQSEVRNQPATKKEVRLFSRSKIVQETLDEISKLLGITIDYEAAAVMWEICRSEAARAEDATPPWCKFFSLDNFKVMEYVSDLAHFWKNGYGFSLSYEQTCPAVREMFQFFESISEQTATVYFAHSGTILKLLAHLGLAKDATKLTHDSFELHRDKRAWRTTRIDAFASNIGFILYECEEDGPKILVMHQERVVQIPGCPENSPCPISVIKSVYSQSLHECDYEKMCSYDGQ